MIILILLCYWHYSICYILFNREALLRDNTIVTRYRRQVAQLLIALIVSFFVLILPHKIWAIIQPQLNVDQFMRIGFHRHSFLIIITRSLLYLNSAVSHTRLSGGRITLDRSSTLHSTTEKSLPLFLGRQSEDD